MPVNLTSDYIPVKLKYFTQKNRPQHQQIQDLFMQVQDDTFLSAKPIGINWAPSLEGGNRLRTFPVRKRLPVRVLPRRFRAFSPPSRARGSALRNAPLPRCAFCFPVVPPPRAPATAERTRGSGAGEREPGSPLSLGPRATRY